MDYRQQLDLQAHLDGELSAAESRRVAEWLARDQQASALAAELRHTRNAVTAFEKDLRLPESREFYWSKIRRELERQPPPAPAPAGFPAWLKMARRWLIPATAVAMVLFVTVMVERQPSFRATETAVKDTGAFTYRDFEKGTTLVWLSYPADNDFAEYEAAMFE